MTTATAERNGVAAMERTGRRAYDDPPAWLKEVFEQLAGLRGEMRQIREADDIDRHARQEMRDTQIEHTMLLKALRGDQERRLSVLDEKVKELEDHQKETDLKIARRDGQFALLVGAIPVLVGLATLMAKLLWP